MLEAGQADHSSAAEHHGEASVADRVAAEEDLRAAQATCPTDGRAPDRRRPDGEAAPAHGRLSSTQDDESPSPR